MLELDEAASDLTPVEDLEISGQIDEEPEMSDQAIDANDEEREEARGELNSEDGSDGTSSDDSGQDEDEGSTMVADEAQSMPTISPELLARIDGLEASLVGIDAQLEGTAEVGANVERMQQIIMAVMEHLKQVGGQVEMIQQGLQATVGFAAHENFNCDSCNSQGLVATKLLCTSCGKEHLWGWSPPPAGNSAPVASDGVADGTAADPHIPVQAL